ncbi:hypothetical protein J41TS4_20390 [Paenibacillus apis]|uniref:Uncharacterized protein n=2 Tax=Paenibacillus apis TaxID=1792174 RepID=A0A920CJ21_9BACL|nr:hypothetical protein J41TS4_20390 [Paenibacillus apis]
MELTDNSCGMGTKPGSDCVIFMSAYKSSYFTKKIFLLLKKEQKAQDLLNKHHVSSIMTNDRLLTPEGILKIQTSYNVYNQRTFFEFELYNQNDDIEDYDKFIEETKWCLSLIHSVEMLLDPSNFEASLFINMDSFLVFISDKKFQVDPLVFFMNEVMFICFELIDFDSGEPIRKENIYGRANNYNITPISKIKFFGSDEVLINNKRIPDIIFENVNSLLEKITRGRLILDKTSYLHNLLVITDSISNVTTYFQSVLGEKISNIKLDNISTKDTYDYYSQEYLGAVIIVNNEHRSEVLWDVQVLEILKMYILLNQIVSYDLTLDLKRTLDEKMYIDQLLLMSRAPIITTKAIKNIQLTESFEKFKESINFKISYLNMYSERRKNRNALLLNVLLYVISFIGSVGTFQILQEEFNLSFKISFIVLTSIFFVLGVLWISLERKK